MKHGRMDHVTRVNFSINNISNEDCLYRTTDFYENSYYNLVRDFYQLLSPDRFTTRFRIRHTKITHEFLQKKDRISNLQLMQSDNNHHIPAI